MLEPYLSFMSFVFCRWLWIVSPSAGLHRTPTPDVRTATCTSPNRTGQPCRVAGAARLGRRPTITARRIPSHCWSGCTRFPVWTTPVTTLISDWDTKCSTGTARSSGTASKRCLQVSPAQRLFIEIFVSRHNSKTITDFWRPLQWHFLFCSPDTSVSFCAKMIYTNFCTNDAQTFSFVRNSNFEDWDHCNWADVS